ncbi:MAG: REP-associated tyrosine transposase [Methylococcales bacterium]
MPDFRRYRVPGGTYFFTVNLLERRLDTLVRHVDALREAVRVTQRRRPFHMDAWVVLPDHMHAVWTLPRDDDFSNRWKAIKIRFVQAVPRTERRSRTRVSPGECGIWQRRFWEHVIRDDIDYERHVDYMHWNPIKHGLVQRLADWPYSSFHRYVRLGILPPDWAGGNIENESANYAEPRM